MLYRILLLPLISFGLSGQSAEFSVHGGVSRLNNTSLGGSQGAQYRLTDGWRIGFRTTLNSWSHFGHEFGYAYNRTQLREETSAFEQGMANHQGFYNILAYATGDGSRVRPFGTAGVHFGSYVPPGSSITSGGASTKFGFNYGGGVKVRVRNFWQVRFDARYYQNPKPFEFLQNRSGWLGQLEASIGFGIVI